MTTEIYKLFSDNLPLPKGTRINTTIGGIPTGGTHELTAIQLESANRRPNHMSDYVPFWILGWRDLHDDLSLANTEGMARELTAQDSESTTDLNG